MGTIGAVAIKSMGALRPSHVYGRGYITLAQHLLAALCPVSCGRETSVLPKVHLHTVYSTRKCQIHRMQTSLAQQELETTVRGLPHGLAFCPSLSNTAASSPLVPATQSIYFRVHRSDHAGVESDQAVHEERDIPNTNNPKIPVVSRVLRGRGSHTSDICASPTSTRRHARWASNKLENFPLRLNLEGYKSTRIFSRILSIGKDNRSRTQARVRKRVYFKTEPLREKQQQKGARIIQSVPPLGKVGEGPWEKRCSATRSQL